MLVCVLSGDWYIGYSATDRFEIVHVVDLGPG